MGRALNRVASALTTAAGNFGQSSGYSAALTRVAGCNQRSPLNQTVLVTMARFCEENRQGCPTPCIFQGYYPELLSAHSPNDISTLPKFGNTTARALATLGVSFERTDRPRPRDYFSRFREGNWGRVLVIRNIPDTLKICGRGVFIGVH